MGACCQAGPVYRGLPQTKQQLGVGDGAVEDVSRGRGGQWVEAQEARLGTLCTGSLQAALFMLPNQTPGSGSAL